MGPMKLNIRTFSFAAALLAAVLAASQTTGTAPQGDLIALENRYITAMVEANRADLEKLLAPDYLSVAATGDVFDRAQTLGFYRPGELRGASAAEMKVRVYGVTAVVIGRYDQTDKAGALWSGRFTDVWVRAGNSWQLVSEHFCKLAQNDSTSTH